MHTSPPSDAPLTAAAGASINRSRNGTNGANGGEGGKELHQKTRRGNKRDDDNTAFSDNAVTTAVRGGVPESKNNIDHALRASRRSQFPPLPWLARSGVAGHEVADDDVGDEFGETFKHSHGSNDKDDQNCGGEEELTSSGGGGARRGDRRSEKAAMASTTGAKQRRGNSGDSSGVNASFSALDGRSVGLRESSAEVTASGGAAVHRGGASRDRFPPLP